MLRPFSDCCFAISSALYVAAVAPAGPWDAFNYAPSSKTVFPVEVISSIGDVEVTVDDATNSMTLANQGSYVTLDFLKEVTPCSVAASDVLLIILNHRLAVYCPSRLMRPAKIHPWRYHSQNPLYSSVLINLMTLAAPIPS